MPEPFLEAPAGPRPLLESLSSSCVRQGPGTGSSHPAARLSPHGQNAAEIDEASVPGPG